MFLQLVKKFPAFYGTRKFITVLTSARHLSLSWANSIQSPQAPPTSWRSILILYLANSLVASVSEPALYRVLTFHVPNKMSLFRFLRRDASSRNTPRPRRSELGSGLPPDCFVSPCECCLTWVFTGKSCQHLIQPPSWRTTSCRLSATDYLISF
jgi:hypothetical protein